MKSKREKGAVVANQRPPASLLPPLAPWIHPDTNHGGSNVIRNNFISSLCISSRPSIRAHPRTCLILFSRNRIFVVAPTRATREEKVISRKLGKIGGERTKVQMQAPLLGIIDRPRDKSTKLEEEDIYIYI